MRIRVSGRDLGSLDEIEGGDGSLLISSPDGVDGVIGSEGGEVLVSFK